jgi:hypothetical protein
VRFGLPLLAAIERWFLQQGVHTSWWTLRQELSTHQVVTVVLPTADGRVPRIRKATVPEPQYGPPYPYPKSKLELSNLQPGDLNPRVAKRAPV